MNQLIPENRSNSQQDRLSSRFEIRSVLGEGGMGIVYAAYQTELRRMVAIKTSRTPDLSPAQRARFVTEAQAAARLDHPHIVPILEIGDSAGQPFLVMPLVDGYPLSDACEVHPLPYRDAAGLIAKVAAAVHYAHQRQVLHRDLKPPNILLDDDGEPRITDFGLARILDHSQPDHTRTGQGLGTFGYAAPEQREGRLADVGPWSDVFSLGATLAELLLGTPVFRDITSQHSLHEWARLSQHPLRQLDAVIPSALEAICVKALASDPAERYPSAAALADDLQRFLEGRSVQAAASRESQRERTPAGPKQRRILEMQIPKSCSMAAEAWTIIGSVHALAALGLFLATAFRCFQAGTVSLQHAGLFLLAVLIAATAVPLFRTGAQILQAKASRLTKIAFGSLGFSLVLGYVSYQPPPQLLELWRFPANYFRLVAGIEALLFGTAGLQLLFGRNAYDEWQHRLSRFADQEKRETLHRLRTQQLAALFTHPGMRRFEPVQDRDWHALVNGAHELIYLVSADQQSPVSFLLEPHQIDALTAVPLGARRRSLALLSPILPPVLLTDEEAEELINPLSGSAQYLHLDEQALSGPRDSLTLQDEHRRFPHRLFEIPANAAATLAPNFDGSPASVVPRGMAHCPTCETLVVPMTDGRCPACRRPFRPETASGT